jgi:signal transduction histidine kinase
LEEPFKDQTESSVSTDELGPHSGIREDEPVETRLLSDSDALVKDATKELRTISHLLHPPLLDEVGLPSWWSRGDSIAANPP